MELQANIAGIMSNEAEVKRLIQMMDVAIGEATKLEDQLTQYDNLLSVKACQFFLIILICF